MTFQTHCIPIFTFLVIVTRKVSHYHRIFSNNFRFGNNAHKL